MPAILSSVVILNDVIAAIVVAAPMLNAVGSEFTNEQLTKGQTAIAHILNEPVVQNFDYSNGDGYAANAVNSNSLLVDVPITISAHDYVTITISYLQSISNQKEVYKKAVMVAGSALAKKIIKDGLGTLNRDNFSHETVAAAVNTDYDTLLKIQSALNIQGASEIGRFMVVNTEVAGSLFGDTRITSNEQHGQRTSARGHRQLSNICGFENIFEYPELPDNGVNLSGFAGDKSSLMVKTGLPVHSDLNAIDGMPPANHVSEVTDPDTGLTLLKVSFQKPGVLVPNTALTLLWGWATGKQSAAAAAGDKLDNTGHLLVTAGA